MAFSTIINYFMKLLEILGVTFRHVLAETKLTQNFEK